MGTIKFELKTYLTEKYLNATTPPMARIASPAKTRILYLPL
jgi:hypothetical protein